MAVTWQNVKSCRQSNSNQSNQKHDWIYESLLLTSSDSFQLVCGVLLRDSSCEEEMGHEFWLSLSHFHKSMALAFRLMCHFVTPLLKSCCFTFPTGFHRLRKGEGHHICCEFVSQFCLFINSSDETFVSLCFKWGIFSCVNRCLLPVSEGVFLPF